MVSLAAPPLPSNIYLMVLSVARRGENRERIHASTEAQRRGHSAQSLASSLSPFPAAKVRSTVARSSNTKCGRQIIGGVAAFSPIFNSKAGKWWLSKKHPAFPPAPRTLFAFKRLLRRSFYFLPFMVGLLREAEMGKEEGRRYPMGQTCLTTYERERLRSFRSSACGIYLSPCSGKCMLCVEGGG